MKVAPPPFNHYTPPPAIGSPKQHLYRPNYLAQALEPNPLAHSSIYHPVQQLTTPIPIFHTFQWPVPSSFSPPPHSPTSSSHLAPSAHAYPGAYSAPHIRHATALPSLQLSCHHQRFIPTTLGFQPFKYQPIGNAIIPQTVSSASGSHQSTSLPQTRDTSYWLPVSSSDVTNDCANNYKAHHPQSQPNSPSTRSKLGQSISSQLLIVQTTNCP